MEGMRKAKQAALVLFLLRWAASPVSGHTVSEYTRDDFPADFVFGASTSAYQYEGAAAVDGRAPSVWDAFSHEGFIKDGSTADVAADGYHKYKEDIKLMDETGLQAYRFSLSWSRILPSGRGKVNPKGIQYYNNVIDELVKYGIQPHITIYHYDFPQALEEEYGGWLSPEIIDDFRDFADVCFREFGDRVSFWTTMNEPNILALFAYDYGTVPPQRCSDAFGNHCRGGNSSTEPYVVGHHMILAHSAAVEVYRRKYQAKQKGKIGINQFFPWCDPLTDSIADKLAAQRTMDYLSGWFMNPLVYGDYPVLIKELAGSRLPSFTQSQSQQLKGAFDFIGYNYYFSIFVASNLEALNGPLRDMSGDMLAKFTAYKDQTPITRIVPPDPLPDDPRGLSKALKYIREKYENPIIYIQENGYGIANKDTMNDTKRISYLSGFIATTLQALREGSDVRGYFVWSFVDLFELMTGFQLRLGLYHVDYNEQCKRSPKHSALWYKSFLRYGSIVKPGAKIK